MAKMIFLERKHSKFYINKLLSNPILSWRLGGRDSEKTLYTFPTFKKSEI